MFSGLECQPDKGLGEHAKPTTFWASGMPCRSASMKISLSSVPDAFQAAIFVCPVYELPVTRGKNETCGATGLIELVFRGIDVSQAAVCRGKKWRRYS